MTFHRVSPKWFWGSFATVCLGLLSGCATTGQGAASAPTGAHSFFNVGASAPLALPSDDAPRLKTTAIEALTKDGVYFFNEDKGTHLYLVNDQGNRDHYLVKETFDQGTPHGLSWGTGAEALLYAGEAVRPENMLYAEEARDGHLVVTYGDHADMKLNMKLEAFDVSGMLIRDFLRTRGNQPTTIARFMPDSATFPAGSVAYAMTLWTDKDEVLVPNLKVFTGSNTIEEFSTRFSRSTPYCLRFLPGNVVQPIGMLFSGPIKAQKNQAQNGQVGLYSVKKNTVFCSKDLEQPVANAHWQLRQINGTRVLSFDFPGNVPGASFGMTEENRKHLLTGIAELVVKQNRKLSTQVVPVYVWQKDSPVRDSQYRFNKVAANAIEAALTQAKPLVAKWEAANESDVMRRARAIDAKNAPKAVVAKKLPSKRARNVKKSTRKRK